MINRVAGRRRFLRLFCTDGDGGREEGVGTPFRARLMRGGGDAFLNDESSQFRLQAFFGFVECPLTDPVKRP